jgi:Pvc16 N-terminal domain
VARLPDYSVIADVSKTLETVLTAAFSSLGPQPPVAEIHDLSGQISTQPARLTLFLFEVAEDAALRNRPPVRTQAPPMLAIQKPPMPLVLRYLATPWSGDRETDHKIIGRTLQTLYDEAIISGPNLLGTLASTSQALKIKLVALELEDRARVWHAIQRPYRISLVYEVRFVNLDPTGFELRPPIRSRQLDSAVAVGQL